MSYRRPTTEEEPSAHAAQSSVLAAASLLQRIVAQRASEIDAFTEERHRWLEERTSLRAMLDQVPDYLFVKDRQSRFTIANRAVAFDLGYTPDDILGKTDFDLHPRDLAQRFYSDEQQVILSGIPLLDHEEYVVLSSGEIRWLSTSKLPLRNSAGEIVGLVGVSRDVTRRREAEDRVRYLAFHDQVTGLANRAAFEARLDELSSAANGEQALLLLVDLDRFKQVNDTLGHAAGDQLLRLVGERLTALVGPSDLVARIGGDEFALIVNAPHTTDRLCQTIFDAIAPSFGLGGKLVHIGASVGVTAIDGTVGPMEALRRADLALYAVKARGRGCWQQFSHEMATALERRNSLEDDFRSALADPGQFFTLYQPVYAADSHTIVGAEALVRWRHPRFGILGPASFIDFAEDSGLVGRLGEIVLDEAACLLARSDLPWIAVNVSTVQLHAPDFAERVLRIIRAAGADPHRLQIEITESVLIEDSPDVARSVTQLRDAGVRIALDDFGTGYSSLSYLRRLVIDKLKIDRSFVAQIGTRSADAIIAAVASLGRGLDLVITAEGVETAEQRAFLADIGCHELQGFLLSRPLEARRLLEVTAETALRRS